MWHYAQMPVLKFIIKGEKHMQKRFFKKAGSVILASALLCGGGAFIAPQVAQVGIEANAANVSEKENNNNMEKANSITLGDTVTGSLTANDEKDFYKFTITTSGKFNIELTAWLSRMNFWIYNSDGDVFIERSGYWDSLKWNSTSERMNESFGLDLTEGTYYISFGRYDDETTGNYNFKTTFKSAGETFKESGWGNNNSMKDSKAISFNQTYKGQIAKNDEKDFYSFTLPTSGRLNVETTGYLSDLNFWLYDSDGNVLIDRSGYWDRYKWNSTSEKINASEEIHLTSGKYYICFGRYDDSTGNYDFKTTFASANESIKETGWGINNSMAASSGIKLGSVYNGQLAANDDKDFYKFTISSSTKVTISLTAYFSNLNFYVYDANGTVLVDKSGYWNRFQWDETAKKISQSVDFTASKGTYFICFEKYDNVTGNYNFAVNTPETSKPVSLNKTTMALGKGETFKLTASGGNGGIKWRTSNSKILTVDQSGNVKAVANGTAWITAKGNNGKEKSCKITVKNAPSKITLTKGILTLGVGEKFSVTSGINDGAACAKRTYRTSNSQIVKMTRTDWQGDFVGVKPGVAYVTVRSYNGKESTCKVTVKKAPSKVTISKKAITLKVGQTATLSASIPSDAGCAARTFHTSNSSVVKMTKTNWTGSFKAMKKGTAYITVRTYNGKESSCKVTVV